MNPPLGTFTFLLTDVEGSTRLWETQPEVMPAVLQRHDELANLIIGQNGGTVVKSRGEGDSLFAVFQSAYQAVKSAAELQQAFVSEEWPGSISLSVRMSIHSGEAQH